MNDNDYKIKNLESSIVYLQHEHCKMLQLLHEEIKDLQGKNSELTLQITIQNSIDHCSSATSNIKSNELFDKGHVCMLEKEITNLNTELQSKFDELDAYERKMKHLTDTMSNLTECHKIEVNSLTSDLNKKDAEIFKLKAKLRNLRKSDIDIAHKQVKDDGGGFGQEYNHFTGVQSQFLPPASPYKHLNQVSIHADGSNLRPVVARQTLISNVHLVKNKSSPPAHNTQLELVELSDERGAFSKTIKRPNILPPIKPSSVQNYSQLRNGSNSDVGKKLSDVAATFTAEAQYFNTDDRRIIDKFGKCATTELVHENVVELEIDHLLDLNGSVINHHHRHHSNTTAKHNS